MEVAAESITVGPMLKLISILSLVSFVSCAGVHRSGSFFHQGRPLTLSSPAKIASNDLIHSEVDTVSFDAGAGF